MHVKYALTKCYCDCSYANLQMDLNNGHFAVKVIGSLGNWQNRHKATKRIPDMFIQILTSCIILFLPVYFDPEIVLVSLKKSSEAWQQNIRFKS